MYDNLKIGESSNKLQIIHLIFWYIKKKTRKNAIVEYLDY